MAAERKTDLTKMRIPSVAATIVLTIARVSVYAECVHICLNKKH